MVICVCSLIPTCVFADKVTNKKINNIIKGNQDFLILATLGEKRDNCFDVKVYDVIGNPEFTDEERKEYVLEEFPNSINVYGIDSYMYISEYTGENGNHRNPRKGDNVLISVDIAGDDGYDVKYGVFLVDSTDITEFSFEVPQGGIKNKSEQNELCALWVYAHTKGSISDITISAEGENIYKKSKSGKEEELEFSYEDVFVYYDEFGESVITDNSTYSELQTSKTKSENANAPQKSKWKLVVVILGVGMILGVFFVKFTKKFDKRFE